VHLVLADRSKDVLVEGAQPDPVSV
jgi:hypothetical protein